MQKIILSLYTQTALHAGGGSSDGVIDLPVQREAHTSYPCVFGSSMKGALRAHVANRADNKNIDALFGSEGKEKEGEEDKNKDKVIEGHAGAALVSDARLLLLPIRSLTSQFKWVTCPQILQRFQNDCQRFGKTDISFGIPETIGQGKFVSKDISGSLYLEEYRFNKQEDISGDNIVTALNAFTDKNLKEEQIVILNDDDFAYLVKHTLPVNARNVLDDTTKTSKNLWYEESVPADSVFYCGIMIEDERKKEGKTAKQLSDSFQKIWEETPWLQIGGNESVGMGWCKVHCYSESAQSV